MFSTDQAAGGKLASYPGPSQKAGEGLVRTVCACASLVWSRLQVLKRHAQNLHNRRRGCVHLRSKSHCACIFVPLWSLCFSLALANNRAVSLFSRGSLQQNPSSRFVVAAFNSERALVLVTACLHTSARSASVDWNVRPAVKTLEGITHGSPG